MFLKRCLTVPSFPSVPEKAPEWTKDFRRFQYHMLWVGCRQAWLGWLSLTASAPPWAVLDVKGPIVVSVNCSHLISWCELVDGPARGTVLRSMTCPVRPCLHPNPSYWDSIQGHRSFWYIFTRDGAVFPHLLIEKQAVGAAHNCHCAGKGPAPFCPPNPSLLFPNALKISSGWE